MPSFQGMFEKSGGKPIVYQGKTLLMVDDFPTDRARRFRLVFEACNGKWRQGVSLKIRLKNSKFQVHDEIIKNQIVLWQDTAPQTVEIEIIGKASTIEVKNVWDFGDGVMESWHNGAAMIVETVPTGRRYRCNDGDPDDDFDDIIFRLERVS